MPRLLMAFVLATSLGAQSPEEISRWVEQGRYEEARAWLSTRLATAGQPGAERQTPVFRATLLQLLGYTCNSLGRYAEAQQAAEEGLALIESLPSPARPDLIVGLGASLAVAYAAQAQFTAAEAVLRRVQAIARNHLPAGDRRHATLHEAWGDLYLARNQPPRAEASYRASLAILEQTIGPHHPETAACLLSLAAILRERGKHSEALDAAIRAHAALERSRGSTHPATLNARLQCGLVQVHADPAKAEPILRGLLEDWLASQPHRHITVAFLWSALAAARYAQRDPAGAAGYSQRSLDLLRDLLGPEHPQVVTSMFNQAALLQAAKQKKAASVLRAEAERIRKARGYTRPSEHTVDFRALLPK